MHHELKDNVDVISYQPGVVKTNLAKAALAQSESGSITPSLAASMILRDLGHTPMTNGTMGHEFKKWMTVDLFPGFI